MTNNHVHLCAATQPSHLWKHDDTECRLNEYQTLVTCKEHRAMPINNAFEDWFIESDASVTTLQEKRQLQAAFEAGTTLAIEAAAKIAEDAASMWAKPEIQKANPFAVIRKEECEGIALSIRALAKGGDGK